MRPLLTFVLFACAPVCWSFEPFAVDVTQEEFAEHDPAIDHLLPAGVSLPEFYYIAQFIVPPDTFPKRDGFSIVVLKTDDGRYLLQTAAIPQGSPLDTRQKPRLELQIPQTLAEVVYQIWVNTLLEARYDRKSYAGLDGGTFLFSTYVRGLGWMHGRIWSPDANLPPRWIVEAGEQLSDFVRNSQRDPRKTEAALIGIRDKLFEYLETNGKH